MLGHEMPHSARDPETSVASKRQPPSMCRQSRTGFTIEMPMQIAARKRLLVNAKNGRMLLLRLRMMTPSASAATVTNKLTVLSTTVVATGFWCRQVQTGFDSRATVTATTVAAVTTAQ